MRSITLIIAVAGAYALLRGWEGSPTLLLRSCLAIATLIAGLAFWGIRHNHTTPRMFSLRRATWLDYLSLGAAIVFTEACFVVLTSTLAAPSQEMAIQLRPIITDLDKSDSHSTDGSEGEGNAPESIVGGTNLIDQKLTRNLLPSSNPKPSNKPEVFVELETAAEATGLLNSRIHLRSFALSRFDGTTWSVTPLDEQQLTNPITFPSPRYLSSQAAIRHRIYHAFRPGGTNLFIALQGTISTDLDQLTQMGESIYRLPAPGNPTDGYSYAATARPVHFYDLISESLKPAQGSVEQLDLPPELTDQLKQVAESFIYEPNLARQLIGLRNFLQDNYTYSLITTNTSGTTPLENFLFHEKRGYCEHFATAAALLCRTLGVPSRVAYGWSGGRLYKAQNMFVFRSKDAHAWTEIKLDGYGWVVFDTTPPDDEAVPESHTAPDNEKVPDPASLATQQASADEETTTPFKLTISPWILYTGLGFAGALSIAFLITRSCRRIASTVDGTPLNCPPPSYLIQFKRATAAIGHQMPTGCTLRQHVNHLTQQGVAPDFLNELLEYHYNVIYSDWPANPATERRLSKLIRKWRTNVKNNMNA